MSGKMTRCAYEKMIAENRDWLMKQPDTLERRHIADIIEDSVRFYYEVEPERDAMREALERTVAIEPWRHDEGVCGEYYYCVFCNASRLYDKPKVEHVDGCAYVVARAALARLDSRGDTGKGQ